MAKKTKLMKLLTTDALFEGHYFATLLEHKNYAIQGVRRKAKEDEIDYVESMKHLKAEAEASGKPTRHDYEPCSSIISDFYESANMRVNWVEEKFVEQQRLYRKACTIEQREGKLYFFITEMMPYALSEKEKDAYLAQFSEEAEAEVTEIAGKKFILGKASREIPAEFQGKQFTEDEEFAAWVLNTVRNNALVALIVAQEWADAKGFALPRRESGGGGNLLIDTPHRVPLVYPVGLFFLFNKEVELIEWDSCLLNFWHKPSQHQQDPKE